MIHASGILEPIGPFLSVDFGQWRDGFAVNCLGPLHLVHALYPLKAPEGTGKVLFFAGGGTNGPFDAYSCYCAGKWVLLKMTELLDSECANLQVSIIGTGWVNTKIHAQTLSASEAAGMNLEKTRAFLSEPGKGVSLDTVADCVDWCLAAPRAAVSGRNFSLVSDPWRDPQFIEALIADSELCKFRRIADFPPMNAVPGQAR
jgi:NAD(P)-dependent dehydrogenase (short-subunit alcohol dehydrogenase family)